MRRRAIRMVDRSLVERNWLFGQYIVEFEHGGAGRGEVYGKQLIERLSAKLNAAGINGCSATNLRKFRQFYLTYPEIQQTPSAESSGRTGIRPTLSVESPVTPAAPGQADALHAAGRFTLGWSHYVTLLALDNAEARRFYEIEATVNGWSVRELKRQLDSSLYERLALSRDKQAIRRLAHEGQIVENASDLIKDPLVLEFLGRDVQSHHTGNSCSRRRLVRIGELMPGTFPVCATLKSELSEEECNRIRELSVWGREPDAGGHCRNPMIVLTGTELFAQFNVQTAWQESEGQRKNLASVEMSRPWTLADLTQQAYLGLPPTYQWLWGYRDRRSQQRGSGADYVDRLPDEKGTVPR